MILWQCGWSILPWKTGVDKFSSVVAAAESRQRRRITISRILVELYLLFLKSLVLFRQSSVKQILIYRSWFSLFWDHVQTKSVNILLWVRLHLHVKISPVDIRPGSKYSSSVSCMLIGEISGTFDPFEQNENCYAQGIGLAKWNKIRLIKKKTSRKVT